MGKPISTHAHYLSRASRTCRSCASPSAPVHFISFLPIPFGPLWAARHRMVQPSIQLSCSPSLSRSRSRSCSLPLTQALLQVRTSGGGRPAGPAAEGQGLQSPGLLSWRSARRRIEGHQAGHVARNCLLFFFFLLNWKLISLAPVSPSLHFLVDFPPSVVVIRCSLSLSEMFFCAVESKVIDIMICMSRRWMGGRCSGKLHHHPRREKLEIEPAAQMRNVDETQEDKRHETGRRRHADSAIGQQLSYGEEDQGEVHAQLQRGKSKNRQNSRQAGRQAFWPRRPHPSEP